MKARITCTFATLLAVLFFSSCKKDGNPEPDFVSSFSAKVNGELIERKGEFAYASNFTDTYNVYGIDYDGFAMYVAVNQGYNEGTYSFKEFDTYGFLTYDDAVTGYSTAFEKGKGTVTITRRTDDRVSGTFSMTAVDFNDTSKTIEITDGKFDVAFRD